MNSLPPATQVFLYRALFWATGGYMAVAVLILRPSNWFGFAHCVWAAICMVGSWQLYQAAKARLAAEQREQNPPPPDRPD